jgi:hypothetical protein
MDCGLVLASSVSTTEPLRIPSAIGRNTTLTVHCEFAGMLLPQVLVC